MQMLAKAKAMPRLKPPVGVSRMRSVIFSPKSDTVAEPEKERSLAQYVAPLAVAMTDAACDTDVVYKAEHNKCPPENRKYRSGFLSAKPKASHRPKRRQTSTRGKPTLP